MGFFRKLLRGLGIETENDKKKQPEQPADKYANFNMHQREGEQIGSYAEDMVNGLNFGQSMPNMIMQKPTNHRDVQRIADFLRQGQAEIVDLSGLQSQDCGRILDFLSGAIYALNGSILRINENQFVLMPAGAKILVPQDDGRATSTPIKK